jgi:hypothetical protein
MRQQSFERQVQARITESHPLRDALALFELAEAGRNGNSNHVTSHTAPKHVGLTGPLTAEQHEQVEKIRMAITYIVPLLSRDGAATVEYKLPRRDARPTPHSAWEIDSWEFGHSKVVHRRPWAESAAYAHTTRLARLMLVDDKTLQVFSDVNRITIGMTDDGWPMRAEAGKPLSDLSLLALADRWAEKTDQTPDGSRSAIWENRLLELPLK